MNKQYKEFVEDYDGTETLFERIDDWLYCYTPFLWKAKDYIEDRYYRIRDFRFKLKHGFYPTEYYNLYSHILDYIKPRLSYFRKNLNGYPYDLTEKEWDEKLLEFEEAIDKMQDKHTLEPDEMINNQRIVENFLGKYFFNLWD